MKHYIVSKGYIIIFALAFLFPATIPAIMEFAYVGPRDWQTYTMEAVACLTCAWALYRIFFDFITGIFSVSQEGISLRAGFRTHRFSWQEIAEVDILDVWVGKGYAPWVVFSTRLLTPRDRADFFNQTRKHLDEIACFEYREKVLRELLPLMPSYIAATLRRKAELYGFKGD